MLPSLDLDESENASINPQLLQDHNNSPGIYGLRDAGDIDRQVPIAAMKRRSMFVPTHSMEITRRLGMRTIESVPGAFVCDIINSNLICFDSFPGTDCSLSLYHRYQCSISLFSSLHGSGYSGIDTFLSHFNQPFGPLF